MTQTYMGWDDNEYPWPPPDGWYQAADSKWWPDGYGPGAVAAEAAPIAAPPMENPGGFPPPAAAPPVAAPPAAAPAPAPGPGPAPIGAPPAAVPAPGPGPAPVGAPPIGAPGLAGPPPAASSGGGGSKVLLILGGLFAILLVAGGGIFALTRGGDDEPDDTTAATEATVTGDTTQTSGDDTEVTQPDTTEPDITQPAGSESTATESGGGEAGTATNPHAFGDAVTIFYEDFDGVEKTWVIQILEPAYDGTQVVMDENQFNDPPSDGEVFAIARIKITYEDGPAPGSISELNLKAVGPSAVVLTWFGNYCGVVPDSLETSAELFPGGSVEGNLCYSAADGDIGGLIMQIDTFVADGKVYLSMQ